MNLDPGFFGNPHVLQALKSLFWDLKSSFSPLDDFLLTPSKLLAVKLPYQDPSLFGVPHVLQIFLGHCITISSHLHLRLCLPLVAVTCPKVTMSRSLFIRHPSGPEQISWSVFYGLFLLQGLMSYLFPTLVISFSLFIPLACCYDFRHKSFKVFIPLCPLLNNRLILRLPSCCIEI